MLLQSGGRIGPYHVVGPLGAGGMGEVYRAHDPRIGRDVAIKILPPHYAADPDRLGRFELEAKTTGALNHPNLLVIFDSGSHEGRPYLVTELLEGETLRERISRGAIPFRKAAEWAAQIADGLAAAHAKGIVHRDVKPENIFLSRDERVKLLDFGLAKLTVVEPLDDEETRIRRTGAGMVLGTPAYMAPEQVRGEAVDEHADMFALGIIVTEMVAGQHPWRRATQAETMTAILNADVDLPASLPPTFARIVERMLARDVASRFQSMKDVAFALRFLSGSNPSGESGATLAPAHQGGDAREFLPLTLRRGRVTNARFTPDGNVAYSAAWEGAPAQIFLATPGRLDAIPVGASGTDLLSVSTAGELAVALDRIVIGGFVTRGTLARTPIAGGAARRIRERVLDADWHPDAKSMAVIRHADDGTFVLEHPIGNALRTSAGWLSNVRFSRNGTRIAFVDHPWFGDDGGSAVVIDLDGRELMCAEHSSSVSGLAWSPDDTEVWIAGERANLGRHIVGYDMTGSQRVIVSIPGQNTLHDVRSDGAMLVTQDAWRREVYTARHGEPAEKNLAWYDWPQLTGLSHDFILIEEQHATPDGESGASFFLRPVDGGPAMHLGNGRGRGISPDGSWVAAATGKTGQLELIPTDIGETRVLRLDEFAGMSWWDWFPDGQRLWVLGAARDRSLISRIVNVDGSGTQPLGPGNLNWPCAISPDGESVMALGADGLPVIHSTRGDAPPAVVPGGRSSDVPIVWSEDGRYVFTHPRGKASLTIERLDVTNGERIAWQEIRPHDAAGIVDIFPIRLTPDGERYAFSYRRCISNLFLVTARAPRGR